MKSSSVYVKEMFAISQALAKWKHYLLGKHFIIRTDHKSLKICYLRLFKHLNNKHFYASF